ncbi:hypothetical protein CLOSBL3_11971 [Clostridiaceae bacterium BL-3]|nr:hypothetical protein CLOSBL3_11971 [Clostridiaceae bacterium BL-3]
MIRWNKKRKLIRGTQILEVINDSIAVDIIVINGMNIFNKYKK